jgi:hypothetical protein
LVISGASFCHLLEDEMWNYPRAFLWPLLGWEFPKDTISGSFMEYLMIVLSRAYDPRYTEVFISEIIGLLIIVFLTGKYIQEKIKEKSVL